MQRLINIARKSVPFIIVALCLSFLIAFMYGKSIRISGTAYLIGEFVSDVSGINAAFHTSSAPASVTFNGSFLQTHYLSLGQSFFVITPAITMALGMIATIFNIRNKIFNKKLISLGIIALFSLTVILTLMAPNWVVVHHSELDPTSMKLSSTGIIALIISILAALAEIFDAFVGDFLFGPLE